MEETDTNAQETRQYKVTVQDACLQAKGTGGPPSMSSAQLGYWPFAPSSPRWWECGGKFLMFHQNNTTIQRSQSHPKEPPNQITRPLYHTSTKLQEHGLFCVLEWNMIICWPAIPCLINYWWPRRAQDSSGLLHQLSSNHQRYGRAPMIQDDSGRRDEMASDG